MGMSKKNGLVIEPNGAKLWYKDGVIHRDDGPAVEYIYGNKFWYKNGLRHRIGGPEVERIDGDKECWLYGKYYSEDDYNKKISNLPLLYWERFKEGLWI
jgi:hypothetical protein